MDEIKKINNNAISQNVGTNSKDNYTLLQEKYAKFLSDMQKSEMKTFKAKDIAEDLFISFIIRTCSTDFKPDSISNKI